MEAGLRNVTQGNIGSKPRSGRPKAVRSAYVGGAMGTMARSRDDGERVMRRLAYWGVGVGLAAALFVGWRTIEGVPSAQAADPPSGQGQVQGVPVTAAQAKLQDVPVYLNGLGTVQAFNTAEIQAQVSGYLLALPAAEGAEVHQGDVVAVIDPRPYQAALDHAKAQRAEDEATLESAQLDLKRYQNLWPRAASRPCSRWMTNTATVNKNIGPRRRRRGDRNGADQSRLLHSSAPRSTAGLSLHQIDVGNLVQVGRRKAASSPSPRTSRSPWCSPCRRPTWRGCAMR